MKKLIIGIVLFAVIVTGAFAQKKNTVSVGVGTGISIPFILYTEFLGSYEREIIPQFSVGLNVAGQWYPMALIAVALNSDDFKNLSGYLIDVQAHWYPFAKTFHVDAGLGFSDYLMSMPCLVVTPGLGWRFKFGESGVNLNLILRQEYFFPLGDNLFEGTDESQDLKPVNLLGLRLCLGFSF
jgi:hypothetical protein